MGSSMLTELVGSGATIRMESVFPHSSACGRNPPGVQGCTCVGAGRYFSCLCPVLGASRSKQTSFELCVCVELRRDVFGGAAGRSVREETGWGSRWGTLQAR